ncbi:hypothetical protein CPC08DRAFT_699393 [Agrocybe pediades]|nr:hypothetical protein CPC08DRAFT_699393 [Agrocybe pediades]
MAPLPPTLPETNEAYTSAYETCLRVERALQNQLDNASAKKRTNETTETDLHLVYVRVLGYLLHYIPTRTGLDNLSGEIGTCTSDEALFKLGQMYYDHYLRAFNKSGTPIPSKDASRPSFETMDDMIKDCLEDVPVSHAIAKKQALARDKFRCVVSQSFDRDALGSNAELRQEIARETNPTPPTYTECAHIFSESINRDISQTSEEGNGAATSIWTILERFGYTNLRGELNGAKIHRLENVLTLQYDIHYSFDRLEIWFVATGKPNQYRVCTSLSYPYRGCNQLVTFTTPNPDKLPVPTPAYLAIHAACAQVAQLSGAAKYINKIDQDVEEGTVLNSNGSSAGLLDHALRGLHIAGY